MSVNGEQNKISYPTTESFYSVFHEVKAVLENFGVTDNIVRIWCSDAEYFKVDTTTSIM